LHELSVRAMEAKKIGGKPDEAPTELNKSTHFVQAEKVSSLTASARSRYLSEAMSILGGVHLELLSEELSPQLCVGCKTVSGARTGSEEKDSDLSHV